RGRAERVRQREWRAGADVLVAVSEGLRVARSPEVIRLQGASCLDVETDRGFSQPGWRRRARERRRRYLAVAADEQDVAGRVADEPAARLPDAATRFADLGEGRRDERFVGPARGRGAARPVDAD